MPACSACSDVGTVRITLGEHAYREVCRCVLDDIADLVGDELDVIETAASLMEVFPDA